MKVKKVLLGTVAVTAVGALLAGGTLAYFTDNVSAEDVAVTGNLSIVLEDQLKEESNGKIEAVLPNQKVEDKVSVKNTGDNDAYLRVAVDYGKSEISGEDVMDTFVGAYQSQSGEETFETEEEAIAKVAEYEAMGVSASYEEKESEKVEVTNLKSTNSTGYYKVYYEIRNLALYDNEPCWVSFYIKKNNNGKYIINGEKYVPTYDADHDAGFKEIDTDNVEYVLADEVNYTWERHETVKTTQYVVTHEAYGYGEAGIDASNWTEVKDEANNTSYFYYNQVLKAGETAAFLDSLKMPKTWGNAYMNKAIQLDITAEAIQVDYLEDEEGNAITNAKDAFDAVTMGLDAE